MLDQLMDKLGKDGIHKAAFVSAMNSQIVRNIEQECKEDQNAKDVCFETLIELLKKQKSA